MHHMPVFKLRPAGKNIGKVIYDDLDQMPSARPSWTESDRVWLAKHYGPKRPVGRHSSWSINYDIKYRMGREA